MIFKKSLKKAITPFVFLFSSLGATAQKQFTIKGQLATSEHGKVILTYNQHGSKVNDTAQVTNGAFFITGQIGDPSFAELILNRPAGVPKMEEIDKLDKQELMLESTAITVTGSGGLKDSRVKGGKAQEDYLIYLKQIDPIIKKGDSIKNKIIEFRAAKNDMAIKNSKEQYELLYEKFDDEKKIFIAAHPSSYTAFLLFVNLHDEVIDPDFEPLFLHFSATIRHTEIGEQMAAKIALAKKLNVGEPAPDFSLSDTSGHPLSLSSLKGKNVILSFWHGNFYNLKDYAFLLGKINRRVSGKNAVILNVYYNYNSHEDVDRWQSLIANLSMNDYINVIDRNGVAETGAVSTIANTYGLDFRHLPQMFLIGPDGKILARNLNVADNGLALKIDRLLK